MSDKGVAMLAEETKMSALILEDSPSDAEIERSVLEKCGYRVCVVDNGDEADALLKKGCHDLCIVDLTVKGMDGMALIASVRAAGIRTQLVVVSSNDEESTILCARSALGADDYLTKPIKPILLEAAVGSATNRLRRANAEPLVGFGTVVLDRNRRTAQVDGACAEFTGQEFRVLEILCGGTNRVFTFEDISKNVSHGCTSRAAIRQCIYEISRKIGAGNAGFIKNVKGVGYALVK